jgi:hypothetical protein
MKKLLSSGGETTIAVMQISWIAADGGLWHRRRRDGLLDLWALMEIHLVGELNSNSFATA